MALKMKTIQLLKRNKPIKTGKVLKEGIIDGQKHYTVEWEDGYKQITAALSSIKYRYIFK